MVLMSELMGVRKPLDTAAIERAEKLRAVAESIEAQRRKHKEARHQKQCSPGEN